MRLPLSTLRLWEEAVEQVDRRVERVTAVLERSQIPYQVVGGLAVSSWVATEDPAAVRATRDVDIVIRQADLERVKSALEAVGFRYRHAMGVNMFLDPESERARDAVHVLFAGEKVRASDPYPVPDIQANPPRAAKDYAVAPVAALVQMKLTSFRRKDQMHLLDMIEVGLITPEIERGLPQDLLTRLEELKNNPEG